MPVSIKAGLVPIRQLKLKPRKESKQSNAKNSGFSSKDASNDMYSKYEHNKLSRLTKYNEKVECNNLKGNKLEWDSMADKKNKSPSKSAGGAHNVQTSRQKLSSKIPVLCTKSQEEILMATSACSMESKASKIPVLKSSSNGPTLSRSSNLRRAKSLDQIVAPVDEVENCTKFKYSKNNFRNNSDTDLYKSAVPINISKSSLEKVKKEKEFHDRKLNIKSTNKECDSSNLQSIKKSSSSDQRNVQFKSIDGEINFVEEECNRKSGDDHYLTEKMESINQFKMKYSVEKNQKGTKPNHNASLIQLLAPEAVADFTSSKNAKRKANMRRSLSENGILQDREYGYETNHIIGQSVDARNYDVCLSFEIPKNISKSCDFNVENEYTPLNNSFPSVTTRELNETFPYKPRIRGRKLPIPPLRSPSKTLLAILSPRPLRDESQNLFFERIKTWNCDDTKTDLKNVKEAASSNEDMPSKDKKWKEREKEVDILKGNTSRQQPKSQVADDYLVNHKHSQYLGTVQNIKRERIDNSQGDKKDTDTNYLVEKFFSNIASEIDTHNNNGNILNQTPGIELKSCGNKVDEAGLDVVVAIHNSADINETKNDCVAEDNFPCRNTSPELKNTIPPKNVDMNSKPKDEGKNSVPDIGDLHAASMCHTFQDSSNYFESIEDESSDILNCSKNSGKKSVRFSIESSDSDANGNNFTYEKSYLEDTNKDVFDKSVSEISYSTCSCSKCESVDIDQLELSQNDGHTDISNTMKTLKSEVITQVKIETEKYITDKEKQMREDYVAVKHLKNEVQDTKIKSGIYQIEADALLNGSNEFVKSDALLKCNAQEFPEQCDKNGSYLYERGLKRKPHRCGGIRKKNTKSGTDIDEFAKKQTEILEIALGNEVSLVEHRVSLLTEDTGIEEAISLSLHKAEYCDSMGIRPDGHDSNREASKVDRNKYHMLYNSKEKLLGSDGLHRSISSEDKALKSLRDSFTQTVEDSSSDSSIQSVHRSTFEAKQKDSDSNSNTYPSFCKNCGDSDNRIAPSEQVLKKTDEETTETSDIFGINQVCSYDGLDGIMVLNSNDDSNTNLKPAVKIEDPIQFEKNIGKLSHCVFVLRKDSTRSLEQEALKLQDNTKPTFGTKIVTPPSDRKPAILYEKSSPSTLRSINESSLLSEDGYNIRGAGVGSDSESDREFEEIESQSQYQKEQVHSDTYDLNQQTGEEAEEQQEAEAQQQHQRSRTPEEFLSEILELSKARSGASTPEQQQMMADITGALDLSEITRLITSASASAKPNDLKDMILKISQNKKASKYTKSNQSPKQVNQDATPQAPRLSTVNRDVDDESTNKELAHKSSEVTNQAKPPQAQQKIEDESNVTEAHFNGRPLTQIEVTNQRSSFHTEIEPNNKRSSFHTKIRSNSTKKTGQRQNESMTNRASLSDKSTSSTRVPADGKSDKITRAMGGQTTPKQQHGTPPLQKQQPGSQDLKRKSGTSYLQQPQQQQHMKAGNKSSHVQLQKSNTNKQPRLSSAGSSRDSRDRDSRDRDSRDRDSRDRDTLTGGSNSGSCNNKRNSGSEGASSRSNSTLSSGNYSDKNNNNESSSQKQQKQLISSQQKSIEKSAVQKPRQSNVKQALNTSAGSRIPIGGSQGRKSEEGVRNDRKVIPTSSSKPVSNSKSARSNNSKRREVNGNGVHYAESTVKTTEKAATVLNSSQDYKTGDIGENSFTTQKITNNSNLPPSTPKHLVLREKNFNVDTPGPSLGGTREMVDVNDDEEICNIATAKSGAGNDEEIIWRSPRPSSVISRSSRDDQDSSYEANDHFSNYYNLENNNNGFTQQPTRPSELEGAQMMSTKQQQQQQHMYQAVSNVNDDSEIARQFEILNIDGGNYQRHVAGVDSPQIRDLRQQQQQQNQVAVPQHNINKNNAEDKRMSSTPVRPDQQKSILLGTQDNFSHIVGLSPDRRLYDSQDSTLISEDNVQEQPQQQQQHQSPNVRAGQRGSPFQGYVGYPTSQNPQQQAVDGNYLPNGDTSHMNDMPQRDPQQQHQHSTINKPRSNYMQPEQQRTHSSTAPSYNNHSQTQAQQANNQTGVALPFAHTSTGGPQQHPRNASTQPVTSNISISPTTQHHPTLLTNQPLSKTDFANKYLNNQHSQGYYHGTGSVVPNAQQQNPAGLASWQFATVPVTSGGPDGGKLSSGMVTSSSGDEIHIKVASELRIPEVCCTGLSTHGTLTLHNPGARWLHTSLKLVSLVMDGKEADTTRVMPFVMKEKVIVEPHSFEEVKVIFAPRQAGVYVGQLHVVASPVVSDQPLQLDRVPAMVTLQALAETPKVQILTPEENRGLDFGAIPWGCHKGSHIVLVNRGHANVPVRLVISSHKSQGYHTNCFTFDRYTTGDTSLISNKMRPSIPSMSPCVVNYTLPGCSRESGNTKSQQVTVFFVAPCKQLDKGYKGPPEEFTAKMDLEVDTPSSVMNLGSVVLRCVVGVARLHAPRDLEEITLQADVGKFQTQVVPLRNAGNIPIDVSLELTHHADCFATIPMQLMIEPGGQSEITIKYEPKPNTTEKVESLLLMLIEPEGPSYEIELIGKRLTRSNQPTLSKSKSTPSKGPVLLSNKHFLTWGGVPLGRARQQSLALKNVSEQMLKLRLEMRCTHENFQIQSLYGNKERLSMSKEIIMKPLEQYPVHVLFAPTKVNSREGKLVIRVVNTSTKYTIPLSGYGGISKLVMEGVHSGQNSNFWTSIGSIEPGKSIVSKAVIKNMGTRAAYVKCIGFQDLRCKKKLQENRIAFQPEEFCIKEKQTQQLTVIFHPCDKDCLMCQENANIVTTVGLLYGDEVSRQQLRRSVQKYGTRILDKCPEDNPARGYNFHTPFEGEDLICEGDAVKDSPNDVNLFYSNMSKMTFSLVGEPQPSSCSTISQQNLHQSPHKQIVEIPAAGTKIPINVRTSGGGAFSQDMLLQTQQTSAEKQLEEMAPATWGSDFNQVNNDTSMVGTLDLEKLKAAINSEGNQATNPATLEGRDYGNTYGRHHVNPEYSPPVRLGSAKKNVNVAGLRLTSASLPPLSIDTQTYAGGVSRMGMGPGADGCSTSRSLPAPTNSATVSGALMPSGLSAESFEWNVYPEQLVLMAPTISSDQLIKHVQLINLTDHPLSFELSWPAHCITVSPEQGVIGSKKALELSVSVNASIRSKGVCLPWSGNVHINCGGDQKVLKVQIRDSTINDDSYTNTPTKIQPLVAEKGTPLVTVVTPLPRSRLTETRQLPKSVTQQCGFETTVVGKTAETEMEIGNVTAQPVKWTISSFTPPYLKGASIDESVVLRVAYSAFWLPKQTGLLGPGEKAKVLVCFQPREHGLYSQHWELKSVVQASALNASYITKLEFYGEAAVSSEPEKICNPKATWTESTTATIRPSQSRTSEEAIKKPLIELKSERVIFPDTPIREMHECKLEIKNCDKKLHSVNIVAPQSPFRVRHHKLKLKSRHYVRIPIEFAPKKAGYYQAELVLKPDDGTVLTVPLIGSCTLSESSC